MGVAGSGRMNIASAVCVLNHCVHRKMEMRRDQRLRELRQETTKDITAIRP